MNNKINFQKKLSPKQIPITNSTFAPELIRWLLI